MSCQRCGGSGKIHLLGPNTASCPDCQNTDTWTKKVWELKNCTLLLQDSMVKAKKNVTFGASSTEEFIIRNGRNNIVWEANSGSYGWAGGVVTDFDALVDWLEDKTEATLIQEV